MSESPSYSVTSDAEANSRSPSSVSHHQHLQTSPKVATSPYQQVSPLPSPARVSLGGGGPATLSPAPVHYDTPLNLSKPRRTGDSGSVSDSGICSPHKPDSPGGPHPVVQPPPAHSNRRRQAAAPPHPVPTLPPPDLMKALPFPAPHPFLAGPFGLPTTHAAVMPVSLPNTPLGGSTHSAQLNNSKSSPLGSPILDKVSLCLLKDLCTVVIW